METDSADSGSSASETHVDAAWKKAGTRAVQIGFRVAAVTFAISLPLSLWLHYALGMSVFWSILQGLRFAATVALAAGMIGGNVVAVRIVWQEDPTPVSNAILIWFFLSLLPCVIVERPYGPVITVVCVVCCFLYLLLKGRAT